MNTITLLAIVNWILLCVSWFVPHPYNAYVTGVMFANLGVMLYLFFTGRRK